MRDEVEEFLRRVAQMRQAAEAQAKAQQQRPVPAKPAAPPPPKRPPPPQRLVPARQDPVPLPEAEVVEAEISDRSEGFSRRVAQDLRGAEQISEHTRHLGEEVDLADDKLAAHLHEVFDHQLGRLKTTASEPAAIPQPSPTSDITASDLSQMLRSPTLIRNAIIMSEVLRRPEDRW